MLDPTPNGQRLSRPQDSAASVPGRSEGLAPGLASEE